MRNIQSELNARGYDAEPGGRRRGPRTRAAIRRYQQANGLPVDSAAAPELWRRLQRQASRP